MNAFNLVDDPWIPVRWLPDATYTWSPLISLEDAFARSSEIADLDAAPHERIGLVRLLICIAHAALGAPDSPDEWEGFGGDLEKACVAYLKREDIHSAFDLFGSMPLFLQEDLPAKGELVPASKLFMPLATGNNPTLLDHGGMLPLRQFPDHRLALALLTFQNFYPLYGAGFKGRGPCVDGNAIHCLLVGSSLRETILANMIDADTLGTTACESFGRPIWECRTPAELDASTRTFLGRLVPRHRSLRLHPERSGFYHRQKSLIYPNWEPHREPSTAVVIDRKDQRRLAPARLDRAIWRDLHHLTAIRFAGTLNAEAPAVLRSHRAELEDEAVELWTGALITDLKAKILDTLESTFTVPRNLLEMVGRNLYAAGVDFAEATSSKLYGAIRTYGSTLSHESPPVNEGQKHYWHRLDQEHLILIKLAASPEAGLPPLGSGAANDPWTKTVRSAAIAAFEAVCPRATPRQIEAFAKGYRVLHRSLYPKPSGDQKSL